jgi:hypothetical protein
MNAVEVIGDDVEVKQFLVLSQNDVVEVIGCGNP